MSDAQRGADAPGIVSRWSDENGWGVIESPEVSGLVWTHYSVVGMSGFRTLSPGDDVVFSWERFAQDGCEFRATSVHRRGQCPAQHAADTNSDAMSSSLRITPDGSAPRGRH